MRRLTLATTLALLALAAGSQRGRAARHGFQCPAVKVSCPDTAPSGEEVTFTAEVTGGGATFRPAYTWQVSAGTISAGPGTPSIKVDTTGVGGGTNVTATVAVAGISPACERQASCTTAIPYQVIGCGLDEYGDIKFDDEKARLDNFAIEMQNDPTAKGYIICYGGRRGYEGEAQRRCDRAKKYVTTVRGIDPGHVVTVDGGFREDLTVRLTIVPAGATPPAPSPTVDPREVVIIKRTPRRPKD